MALQKKKTYWKHWLWSAIVSVKVAPLDIVCRRCVVLRSVELIGNLNGIVEMVKFPLILILKLRIIKPFYMSLRQGSCIKEGSKRCEDYRRCRPSAWSVCACVAIQTLNLHHLAPLFSFRNTEAHVELQQRLYENFISSAFLMHGNRHDMHAWPCICVQSVFVSNRW